MSEPLLNQRSKKRHQPKAIGPWINWYINRGIIPLNFTENDLRRISWRKRIRPSLPASPNR